MQIFRHESEVANTIEILRNLVDKEKANPEAEISIRGCKTMLELAAYGGKQEFVEFLLEQKVEINLSSKIQITYHMYDTNHFLDSCYGMALHAASAAGKVHIVDLLIKRGICADTKGGFYGTALQAASAHGHVEVVEVLLNEYDVNPNAQCGRLCLHGKIFNALNL